MTGIDEGDERLRLLVDRVLRLEDERDGITQDIRDVHAEAKAVGYDSKTFRKVCARARIPLADREEADILLRTYEAALGGEAVEVPDARPDARALAMAMLAEQVAGLEDSAQVQALVEHATALMDIRADIAQLRKEEAARKALAQREGFLVKPLMAAIRWIENCAMHGRDAMRAGEATYQMYRGSIEAGGSVVRGVSGETEDPALRAAFGGPQAPARAASALAWHDIGDR
ncbi:DUF2312 domain-containing protein [Alteriqipengyuania sp.]|uniref:DUF2312 domain-containing protein n=1 Tax=Alteriqipengyuania sp. TaxID=2800692 RepID=UPI0035135E3C